LYNYNKEGIIALQIGWWLSIQIVFSTLIRIVFKLFKEEKQ